MEVRGTDWICQVLAEARMVAKGLGVKVSAAERCQFDDCDEAS